MAQTHLNSNHVNWTLLLKCISYAVQIANILVISRFNIYKYWQYA